MATENTKGQGKLTKRQVDVRSLKYGDPEKISGNKVKQGVTIRVGIEQELSTTVFATDDAAVSAFAMSGKSTGLAS